MIIGQDRAVEQFTEAWNSLKVHHAWLLAGSSGVGKASFARAAARRVLAEAAGPPFDLPRLNSPDEHPMVKLIDAGSHPDMRWLERLPKEKGDGLARNISVAQIRELGEFLDPDTRFFGVAGCGHRHDGRARKPPPPTRF